MDQELIKSIKALNLYPFSEFQWVREYQEAVIQFYEDVIESIGIGLCLHLDVDPSMIHKSQKYKIPSDILLKASNGEEISEFYKSIFHKLKKKYEKNIKDYKKFKFFKGTTLSPIKFAGKMVYDEITKKPITNEHFELMADQIQEYLGDTVGDAGDSLILRAALMGKLMEKMDKEGITKDQQKRMSHKEVEDKYGPLPTTEEEAEAILSPVEMNAVKWAKSNAAKYLSIKDGDIKKKVVDIIRQQISSGIQEGLSAQEMTQRLFWVGEAEKENLHLSNSTLEAWNRDFRRIALTEMNTAFNSGYMMAQSAERKGKEKIYLVFDGSYNPQERPREACNRWLGEIVLLVDEARSDDSVKDEYARYCVWPGKSNAGRGKDQWVCLPVHPHCTHFWTRVYPEFQEWDDELKKIIFKVDVEKSFRDGKMNLIKSDKVQEKKNYDGIDIDIEWPKGTTRQYKGSSYQNKMQADYGYINNTNSPDGEEIDVYLNNPAVPNANVFMLLQKLPNGEFDEFKFMIGFPNEKTAEDAYVNSMAKELFGGIVMMSMANFKKNMLKFFQKKKIMKSLVHVDNIEWKEKRANLVQEELKDFAEKVKGFLRLKNPIIVHLYKGKSGERAQYDEGVILLYENTPDWRGDFLHELSHQLIRKQTIKKDKVVYELLKKKQKELEKNEGDGRIFTNDHTYSNVKEIAATYFKWYILGKIVDNSYLEALNNYQPDAVKVVEKLLKSDYVQKSMDISIRNTDGTINYHAVPLMKSVLIRVDGKRIPFKRISKNFFLFDSEKADRELKKSFDSFSFLVDENGRPKNHEKKVNEMLTLLKSKMVWVAPSGKKKGYYRFERRHKEEKKVIYVDMDGVLTDFDKQFGKYSDGMSPQEYKQKFGEKKKDELIESCGEEFWSTMEWMFGGKELLKKLEGKEWKILSSPGPYSKAIAGKEKWIKENLGIPKNRIIFEKEKYRYALGKDYILIDDYPKNTEAWKKAGGTAILWFRRKEHG